MEFGFNKNLWYKFLFCWQHIAQFIAIKKRSRAKAKLPNQYASGMSLGSANNHTHKHTQVGQWHEIAFCWQVNKHTKLLLLLKMFLTLCYDLFVFIKIEIQRQKPYTHKPKTCTHTHTKRVKCKRARIHKSKTSAGCGFHFSELSH